VCKAHEDADPCEVAHANTVSRRPNRENDGAREGPIGSGVVGFRWGCFNSCPAQFSYSPKSPDLTPRESRTIVPHFNNGGVLVKLGTLESIPSVPVYSYSQTSLHR
jgi:hypothetical protein